MNKSTDKLKRPKKLVVGRYGNVRLVPNINPLPSLDIGRDIAAEVTKQIMTDIMKATDTGARLGLNIAKQIIKNHRKKSDMMNALNNIIEQLN